MLAPQEIVFHHWLARCMFCTHLFTARSLVHIVFPPQPSLVVLHHSPDRFGSSFHKNSTTHTYHSSHAVFLPRTLRIGVPFPAPFAASPLVGGQTCEFPGMGCFDVKKTYIAYRRKHGTTCFAISIQCNVF